MSPQKEGPLSVTATVGLCAQHLLSSSPFPPPPSLLAAVNNRRARLLPLYLANAHLTTVGLILSSGLLKEGARGGLGEWGDEEAENVEGNSSEQRGEGVGRGVGGGDKGGVEKGEWRDQAEDMAVLAFEALKESAAIQKRELGKDHPAVAKTHALAADVYWQIGQTEEAEVG
ncbi:unnamed protein product [Closterium sp. Yama58-4]|nr:unnamed protein product [Closterium sp. Yama58-4]